MLSSNSIQCLKNRVSISRIDKNTRLFGFSITALLKKLIPGIETLASALTKK